MYNKSIKIAYFDNNMVFYDFVERSRTVLDSYFSNPDWVICFEHKKNQIPAMDFHLHERFEIYFFISGNVNYFIDRKVYPLKYGDLLVMNNHEIHKPSFLDDSPYERMVVHFDPSVTQIFQPHHGKLLDCFINRPSGEQNRVSLNEVQTQEIKVLFKRLEKHQDDPSEYGKILKLTSFLELLVYVNRLFEGPPQEEISHIPEKLAPILNHIDNNLKSDLSLEALEKKFFINASYLSRLFKKCVGSSIHEYIVYKRISKAKELLAKGLDASEICSLCGFNDFSNFSRTFKRTVGITIREFKTKSK